MDAALGERLLAFEHVPALLGAATVPAESRACFRFRSGSFFSQTMIGFGYANYYATKN